MILLDKGSVARKLSVILTIEGILENKIVSVFETFNDNELLVNQFLYISNTVFNVGLDYSVISRLRKGSIKL